MPNETEKENNLEKLKQEAKNYHKLGLPVIPFIVYSNPEKKRCEKENIGQWKKWQTEQQTDKEFNDLKWNKNGKKANAFAVLLGTETKNGMYLSVIDFDVKGKVNDKVKEIGKKILKDLPITRIDRTVNGGIHYVYWSRKKVRIDSSSHNETAIEVLGQGKLCLMPPSLGYKKLNDNSPREIESLNDEFDKTLRENGIKRAPKDKLTIEQIKKGVNEGERHSIGIRYVNYLIGRLGFDVNTALIEMSRWNQQCNPPTDKEEIRRMVLDAFKHQKTKIKEEQYRKKRLELEPIKQSSCVISYRSCRFCKKHFKEKCSHEPDPNTCRAYEENKQISDTDKILLIIEDMDKRCYKDQNGILNIWIDDEGIYKNYKINSKAFKYFLNKIFLNTFGRGLNREKLKDAILNIETFADNGETIRTYVRVGKFENSIFVDLCNPSWQSVEILKGKSYKIRNKTPPLFKHYKHMKQLPLPIDYTKNDNGDGNYEQQSLLLPLPSIINPEIENRKEVCRDKNSAILPSVTSKPSQRYPFLLKLREFVNLSYDDFLLALAHIVDAFFVETSKTLLSITGEKGSAKTSTSKCFKSVLDPSITPTMGLPKNRDELLQIIDHHFYPCFDNVSWISHEISDILCRVLTGAGASKRMLWTDDDEFLRELKRAININGINVSTNREDLLDRTILTFSPTLSGKRRTEKEMTVEFEQILPFLLHDLYSLISEVLELLDTIKPSELFRMADFTKIGCCVFEAMGYGKNFFIDVYRRKLDEQIKEAIYNHTLGNIVLAFMEDKNEWEGSPTKLYKNLKDFAKDNLGVSTRSKSFPNAPNLMSRQLNDLIHSFEKIGIELIHDRTGTKRSWKIINHNKKQKENDSQIFDIENIFSKNQFTVCYFCHKPIHELKQLTTVDGKPVHKRCKAKVEAQKKGESS